MRLLAGQDVAHTGGWRLGARVVPEFFGQTHARPEWLDPTLVDLLWHGEPGRPGVDRGRAMAALRRYGLAGARDQTFGTPSGGQQARFQGLLRSEERCVGEGGRSWWAPDPLKKKN